MQFSMRSLLLLTTFIVLALGYRAERAHRQHAVALAVERLHGSLRYSDDLHRSTTRRWLCEWLGHDMIAKVEGVYLGGTSAGDADLVCLEGLSDLRELVLTSTAVGDRGLEHLARLSRLESIDLRFTDVSNEAVEKLRRALPQARILSRSDID